MFRFGDRPAGDGQLVVSIPATVATKKELFDVLVTALPLPDYFGRNWDALSDVLTDLFWLDVEVLVLDHQRVPLEDAMERATYLGLLRDAASSWAGEVPPRLLVLFPESARDQLERLGVCHE
jgi:RNAse (barnase) inhibitor barstar